MNIKLGETEYSDGSADLLVEGLSHQDRETLIRLGFIKMVEDAVHKHADWLREVGDQ